MSDRDEGNAAVTALLNSKAALERNIREDETLIQQLSTSIQDASSRVSNRRGKLADIDAALANLGTNRKTSP